jgi:hypothetical protein
MKMPERKFFIGCLVEDGKRHLTPVCPTAEAATAAAKARWFGSKFDVIELIDGDEGEKNIRLGIYEAVRHVTKEGEDVYE